MVVVVVEVVRVKSEVTHLICVTHHPQAEVATVVLVYIHQ
jgi:hypothetical protein